LNDSHDKKIGTVFTPLRWGKFAVEQFDIFPEWMNGATVFDPTMGSGRLLEALVDFGLGQGYSISELPLESLFGNELNSGYFNDALQLFREKFKVDMSANFSNADILELSPKPYDIILGNPPWQNFVDLPDDYKEKIKSAFTTYDLIDNRKNLLLGGSRIDLAALVVQRTIADFLKPHGNAFFFLPLSLLLNDGAHRYFRKFKIHNCIFSLERIYDFNDLSVFDKILTRYGLVKFKRDKKTSFPVDFYRNENGKWKKYKAKPLIINDDPLSVFSPEESHFFDGFQPIVIEKKSIPRQGINTCGANNIYFFESCTELEDGTSLLNEKVILPTQFIYPLLTKSNFTEHKMVPRKWVLLPYNDNGKPLSGKEISRCPLLRKYLFSVKNKLEQRKGKLIQTQIKKGIWWAMLGVGRYNFVNYKIVWEAYGRNTFKPMLVTGRWQVNQSLQAYMPVVTKTAAQKILNQLQNPVIETYLLSLKMEKTMNWAQPGKIKKLLKIKGGEEELY